VFVAPSITTLFIFLLAITTLDASLVGLQYRVASVKLCRVFQSPAHLFITIAPPIHSLCTHTIAHCAFNLVFFPPSVIDFDDGCLQCEYFWLSPSPWASSRPQGHTRVPRVCMLDPRCEVLVEDTTIVTTTWHQSTRAKADISTSAINGANVFVAPSITTLFTFLLAITTLDASLVGLQYRVASMKLCRVFQSLAHYFSSQLPLQSIRCAHTPLPIVHSTSSSFPSQCDRF